MSSTPPKVTYDMTIAGAEAYLKFLEKLYGCAPGIADIQMIYAMVSTVLVAGIESQEAKLEKLQSQITSMTHALKAIKEGWQRGVYDISNAGRIANAELAMLEGKHPWETIDDRPWESKVSKPGADSEISST